MRVRPVVIMIGICSKKGLEVSGGNEAVAIGVGGTMGLDVVQPMGVTTFKISGAHFCSFQTLKLV